MNDYPKDLIVIEIDDKWYVTSRKGTKYSTGFRYKSQALHRKKKMQTNVYQWK